MTDVKIERGKLPFDPTTVLLYGDTGSGKTPNWGWLAKYIYKSSKRLTRVYLADNGGLDSVKDVIDAGIAKVIDVRGLPHPYLVARNIARGYVPEITGEAPDGTPLGKWVKADNRDIGLYVYESFTGIAERLFRDLSEKAAKNINIGGEGAYNFDDGDAGWGKVTIGSSNRTHYNVVHQELQAMTTAFSNLAANNDAIVLSTATVDRGETDGTRMAILGPKTIGKALTAEVPRMFAFTFHLTLEPKPAGEPDHKLWMISHPERTAGNALALANRRLPMLKPGHPLYAELAQAITPADVVKALQINQDVAKRAVAELKKEMGL